MKQFTARVRQRKSSPYRDCASFYAALGERVRELPSFDDEVKAPPAINLIKPIDIAISQAVRQYGAPFVCPPREKGERAKWVIHPSSAFGCHRRVAFDLLNVKEDLADVDAKLHRIFGVGHMGHQRIQGYLFEAWYRGLGNIESVHEDVLLQFSWLAVMGELDSVVIVQGRPYIVEVKTAARAQFNEHNTPKDEWVWQVYLYMAATGIRGAIILVECKDSQRMKQFYVPWEDKVWEEIHDTLYGIIRRVVVKQKLPDGDTSFCFWCRYTKGCDNPTIDWDKALGKISLPIMPS